MRTIALVLMLGCTLPGIPPLPPIGCREMVPQCVCDAGGDCGWVWLCVPL